MSKTEIYLYNELTELIYSKIAYCTVLESKQNNSSVALCAMLVPQPALVINCSPTPIIQ